MYKIKRLPFEKIKEFGRDYFGGYKKCRVKLTSYFGRLFWQQLSDEEFNRLFEKACIRVNGVHTMSELAHFNISVPQREEIDIFGDQLCYRWYIIEDFQEDYSVAGLLFHHAWMDGASKISKLYLQRDDSKDENLMKKAS